MKIDLNDIVSMSSDKIIGSGRIMLEENDTSREEMLKNKFIKNEISGIDTKRNTLKNG